MDLGFPKAAYLIEDNSELDKSDKIAARRGGLHGDRYLADGRDKGYESGEPYRGFTEQNETMWMDYIPINWRASKANNWRQGLRNKTDHVHYQVWVKKFVRGVPIPSGQ